MFLETADCMVVKGTTVEPGSRGGRGVLAVLDGGAAAAAAAGPMLGLEGVIPAAASTSAGVILPYGPVPASLLISNLCCFANFFAYGVATVFLGPSGEEAGAGCEMAGAGVEVTGGGVGATTFAAAGGADCEGEEPELAALALASAISSSVSAKIPIGAPTGADSPSGTTTAARMPS
uniref:Uncharacterized protein n=1 Tax=Rhizophora mucronata TaxID=61149 RepID=A0A2P2LTU8_RHIMU